jgi:predicted Zn-dependent peptidase
MFGHIAYNSTTLPNGLKVLTAQNSSIPVVDAEVWTRTGYRYEKPDELGYAHLLEHMLFGGTKRRPTKYDLALEVDRRGGYFNAGTSQEYVAYDMQMMRNDAELMADILSDMLFGSLLAQDRLELEKPIVLQELKQRQEDPAAYFFRLTQKKLLPGHPLSQNLLDTEQTTLDATPELLRTYLERHYRPDQSAFVMAGDVSHDDAVRLAKKYFGAWAAPDEPFDKRLVPMPRASADYFYEPRDIKQTFLALGYYTHSLGDLRASAAWDLLATFLAAGFTSVLKQEVREKRGLVYGINAYRAASWDTGLFMVSTSTQKPREALPVIEQVIAEIPERLNDAALEKARGQSVGSFTRSLVKPGAQSRALGDDFITYDRIVGPEEWLGHLRAVTRDEVVGLTETYLQPTNSVLVAMGNDDIGR